MVTNGITYGASQLTSDGVSYQKKDGKLTTVKSALDELINTSLTKIDKLEKQVSDYKKLTIYLADNVKEGDYVAYDAGDWETSTKKPTEQGQFGGYTSGKSKNESVACWEKTAPKYNGWRVLSKDDTTKTVTIVHAGQPECYYHLYSINEYSDASVNLLNGRGSQYVNNSYAISGRSMNKVDAEKISETDNLRKMDARYWLATTYSVSTLWFMKENGIISHDGQLGYAYGFRPVVVLKSNILTTGQGQDMFGNKAWILA